MITAVNLFMTVVENNNNWYLKLLIVKILFKNIIPEIKSNSSADKTISWIKNDKLAILFINIVHKSC